MSASHAFCIANPSASSISNIPRSGAFEEMRERKRSKVNIVDVLEI